jgi:hypothetical protein
MVLSAVAGVAQAAGASAHAAAGFRARRTYGGAAALPSTPKNGVAARRSGLSASRPRPRPRPVPIRTSPSQKLCPRSPPPRRAVAEMNCNRELSSTSCHVAPPVPYSSASELRAHTESGALTLELPSAPTDPR